MSLAEAVLHTSLPARRLPTRRAMLGLMAAGAWCDLRAQPSPAPARAGPGRPVVLAEDDRRLFPEPPPDFRSLPGGRLAGRLEAFDYHSDVTGTRRRAQVYLPPGHGRGQRHPVLYLLHGIAGNEYEWSGYVQAHVILDRLITTGQAQPMIVVMPNGRALADDAPGPDPFAPDKVAGFARFEGDLLRHLIPAVQAGFGARDDRLGRAIAGLSMGGGQALNFGLAHLDQFAWVGGFSAAPNTRPPEQLVPDPAWARDRLRLLYLSCGSRDGLIGVSQRVHRQLSAQGVPHLWNVDGHGHDGEAWASNFHHFAQRLFR